MPPRISTQDTNSVEAQLIEKVQEYTADNDCCDIFCFGTMPGISLGDKLRDIGVLADQCTDPQKTNALVTALKHGNLTGSFAEAELLIRLGADRRDERVVKIFGNAFGTGDSPMVRWLLARGIDKLAIEMRDKLGKHLQEEGHSKRYAGRIADEVAGSIRGNLFHYFSGILEQKSPIDIRILHFLQRTADHAYDFIKRFKDDAKRPHGDTLMLTLPVTTPMGCDAAKVIYSSFESLGWHRQQAIPRAQMPRPDCKYRALTPIPLRKLPLTRDRQRGL